jgi:hypothetical protein
MVAMAGDAAAGAGTLRPEAIPVEFVERRQMLEALRGKGVLERESGELVHLGIEPSRRGGAVTLSASGRAGAPDGAIVVEVAADRLAATLEAAIHKFHLFPLYLVPAARWRVVFATVAFGLAANPQWTEIDSAATVELNTRDPLLCDPGHLHVLRELVRVLLAEGGDDANATLYLVAPGKTLVARITPGSPITIECGDAGTAAALAEAARHAAGG